MTSPEDIRSNFPEWPEMWEGLPEDVAYGDALLVCFRPFILHLIDKGLTGKTLRRHMDYLFLLGGQLVDNARYEPDTPADAATRLAESVSPDGGPYCKHLHSAADRKSYDATCRKLHRFLSEAR